MNPFHWWKGGTEQDAARTVDSQPGAMFYAGGTTLVDLMRIDVVTPDALVDVHALPLAEVTFDAEGAHIGANVTNSELAWNPEICRRYPVLSEAILAGATTQIRNLATTAGNLRQRTRCPYFRDVHSACNKRDPGTGCDARKGFDRNQAVLGTSEHCVAVFPSDMCVALAILDATVRTRLPDGATRRIPFASFHLPPGDTPHVETLLRHGELITHVDVPDQAWLRRSRYVKVRDRASYEFALASAAVALDVEPGTGRIRDARVALGGVATRPWRSPRAEQVLVGEVLTRAVLDDAADAALATAVPGRLNGFKIELAKRTLVRAIEQALALPA